MARASRRRLANQAVFSLASFPVAFWKIIRVARRHETFRFWYTNSRKSFNFYRLIKLSMSVSPMVKQVQILHQRKYFLFEVILSTRMSIFDDQQVLLESQI